MTGHHLQLECALCGETVSEEVARFCSANTDRFNGQIFCREHQRRFSACAAVRWQPGRNHMPH